MYLGGVFNKEKYKICLYQKLNFIKRVIVVWMYDFGIFQVMLLLVMIFGGVEVGRWVFIEGVVGQ